MIAGRAPACKWVRLACERHLADLDTGHERGLWWDQEGANHAIQFFEFLRHSKGKWNDEPFVLSPWQAFIVGSLFGWKRADGLRRFRIAFVEVPRKNGKALDVDTPIPTPGGWRRMGDIEAGEFVFAVDGSPTRVIGVSDVMHDRDCYRVAFSDGTSVVADAEHLWETDARTDRDRTRAAHPTVKTTVEIASTLVPGGKSCALKGECNHRVRLADPIQMPDGDFSVHPYILGMWLGDGHSDSARITCSCDDVESISRIRSFGESVRVAAIDGRSKALTLLIGSGERSSCLQARLRRLGVIKNKHIPAKYLRGSVSQRTLLLQGLMDSDGTVSAAGQCEFSTTSDRIRDGFLELARSLGYKPTIKTTRAKLRGKDCGPCYRIQFWSYADRPCVLMARKRARLKPNPAEKTRSSYRQIVAVEPVPTRPVKCIAVEHPQRLYLAGEGMVPTHNTTLAAGIALYLFVCDGEAGAEIYSAATKKDQAKLVFEDAKAFVGRSPDLSAVIERWKHSLQIPAARSKFEALGADADSLDGLNPFVAVCDEIHAWKSRDLWDVLLTGMGAREQPLALPITTAGDFSDSIYNELHTDVEQVLEGVVSDDEVFGYLATTDAEDDWREPRAWAKANPNLGVSLREEELATVIKRAERQPSSQNKVKRNRLNIRTAALDAWLRLDLWDKCGAKWDEGELAGRECFGGLDLANTNDLAAFTLAFPWGMEKGEPVYRLKCWFWCPNDTDEPTGEKLRRKLFPWVQAGYVELTDGNTIDYSRIEATVSECADRYQLKLVCYDPFNAGTTAQAIENAGIEVAKFNQNASNFNEPCRAFERAVASARLLHAGNPVLRWMASNCIARTNGAGYIMPDRKRSRDKIDGIPASVMALAGEMRARFGGEGPSVYETRGVD